MPGMKKEAFCQCEVWALAFTPSPSKETQCSLKSGSTTSGASNCAKGKRLLAQVSGLHSSSLTLPSSKASAPPHTSFTLVNSPILSPEHPVPPLSNPNSLVSTQVESPLSQGPFRGRITMISSFGPSRNSQLGCLQGKGQCLHSASGVLDPEQDSYS